MRAGPTPENRARQLAAMLTSTADLLADPALPEIRRKWLSDRVDRLWHYDLTGSEKQGRSDEIFALVGAVADAAAARRRDGEGTVFYLNLGLLHFRVLFPARAARFKAAALKLFHEAVLVWDKRGRGAGKWPAIWKLAQSIGLRGDPEQIRRIWEDGRRGQRARKSVET